MRYSLRDTTVEYMHEHSMWDPGPYTNKDRIVMGLVEALFRLEIL